jgi:hypothetical protein
VTAIDAVCAMVFGREKLFLLTHPKLIPLILVSGHIALRLPGMMTLFGFFISIGCRNEFSPCMDASLLFF